MPCAAFALFHRNLCVIGTSSPPRAASETDEEWWEPEWWEPWVQVFLDLSVTLSTARQEPFKKSFVPGSYCWLECLASQGISLKKTRPALPSRP